MLNSAIELRFPPMAVAALTALAMWGVAILDSTVLLCRRCFAPRCRRDNGCWAIGRRFVFCHDSSL